MVLERKKTSQTMSHPLKRRIFIKLGFYTEKKNEHIKTSHCVVPFSKKEIGTLWKVLGKQEFKARVCTERLQGAMSSDGAFHNSFWA